MAAPPRARAQFGFYLSCDVGLQVQLRVGGLYGLLPVLRGPASPGAAASAFVVARLVAGGEELGLETRTSFAEAGHGGASWGEQLTLCLKYRDLPCDTHLVLNVWQVSEGAGASLVGTAALALFSKKGRLKTGVQQLHVREGCDVAVGGAGASGGDGGSSGDGAGGSSSAAECSGAAAAAGGVGHSSGDSVVRRLPPLQLAAKARVAARAEAGQLVHLAALYARGDVPRCSWLDALTSKELARICGAELAAAAASQELRLCVELPSFPHAVLYQQLPTLAAVVAAVGASASSAGAVMGSGGSGLAPGAGASSSAAAAASGSGGTGGSGADGEGGNLEGLVLLNDTEVGRENPAELKAAKLARSLTRGLVDRDLKPNSDERRAIAAVLRLPPNRPLGGEERALLWRYRYSLRGDKRALTKFLKSVDWSDAQEARQAAELMAEWAPIEVADALELLSPDFKNDEVRSHAVAVLQQKDDEELLYYLLQLVQALRFEAVDLSRLARFLIARATANPAFATFLHWYLFTEWEDPTFGARASCVHAALVDALTSADAGEAVWEAIRRQTDMVSQLAYIVKELKMSRLKAVRATERLREMLSASGPCEELTSVRVPLPLNPDMLLEGLVPSECACFKSAQLPVKLVFRVSPRPIDWGALAPLSPSRRTAHGSSGAGAGVAGAGQGLDSDVVDADSGGGGMGGSSSEQLGGTGTAAAVIPTQRPSAAAQAAALPASCRTALAVSEVDPFALRCVMIYKKGDDLRQDQFILQMLSLMDRLLKRENLDLRLTPYRVLPTGSDDGLVEFVPSVPLSRLLAEHRSIHRFLLASGQGDPSGPFGVRAEALETFVRSCAGYCVMTYILGVGDRHLDNLMLSPDGRLFHIDFGYILGSDPKPFPPPMKLCKEMIEAMGGADSALYVRFRMLACEAYNILRKNADLILSLFHLMAGASIEAIRANPENALLKLQEKLRLDFDDGQAVEWMQVLINESATAMMPQIMETTHRWAQYWR